MSIDKKFVDEHIFDRRNVEKVITRDQINGVQMISGPKGPDDDGFIFYGSYLYRNQPYPSDVDGTQQYTFCKNVPCSRTDAEKKLILLLKEVVSKILSTPDFYLGDIKAGVDTEIENVIYIIQNVLYKDSIDPLWNAYLKKSKKKDIKRISHTFFDEDKIPQLLIHGYEVTFPKQKVIDLWTDRYNKGIISDSTLEKLIRLIPGKIKGRSGIDQFFTYCEVVRNLLLLRWSDNEILQGFKMIGNREISLNHAIKYSVFYSCKQYETLKDYYCINNKTKKLRKADMSPHIVKIDMFAVINGNIQEYSNLFRVLYNNKDSLEKDPNKRKDILTFGSDKQADEFISFGRGTSGDMKLLISDLTSDMTLYYVQATKKYKKPMKYAKRMFVISRLKRDKKIGQKFYELFHSDTNLLNSVNAQLDIVIAMLSEQKNPPIDILFNQLDEQKFRISKITEFDVGQDGFYDLINQIIKGTMSKKDMIESLTEVRKHYADIISENVLKYLKKKGLWPGPYFSKNNFEFIYG